MSKEYKLECGCSCEIINGRSITILCDEHEEEMDNEPKYKQTKMRPSREL